MIHIYSFISQADQTFSQTGTQIIHIQTHSFRSWFCAKGQSAIVHWACSGGVCSVAASTADGLHFDR